MRGIAGMVKAASASGAATLLLVGATAVPAAAATDCKPCRGGGSIHLRLPGGGSVKLVWPSLPAVPVSPPRPTAPTPSFPAPASASASAGGTPDPSGPASASALPSSGPSTGADASALPSPVTSLPLSELPVPVLSPLLPGRRPAVRVTPTGSPGVTASSTPSAPASPSTSPRRLSHQDGLLPWGPPARVPPPLGPRGAATSAPQAEVLGAVRTTGAVQLAHRWLPLGIGLALIGAGAALFGWRIRKL